MTVDTYRPAAPNHAASLVEWAEAADAAFQLADKLVRTNVCPPAFRGKPQEATAVILLGAELGLSPIHSLRAMFEIRGVIGMYVRAQVALVQAHGHRIWTVDEKDDAVTVAGFRAGDPDHVERVTWTIARARQAGFIRRGARGEPSQYELQPRTMLWARAAGDVARRIAADVLAGIPEMDDPGDGSQAALGDPGAPARVIRRQPVPPPVHILPAAAAPDDVDGAPPAEPRSESPDAGDAPPDTVPPADPVHLTQSQVVDDDVPPDYGDDSEPLITAAQMRKLQPLFVQAGVRGADARHQYLTRWLGRPIVTTNDLTVTEASAVIDRLQRQVDLDA